MLKLPIVFSISLLNLCNKGGIFIQSREYTKWVYLYVRGDKNVCKKYYAS
jgi:hypothetical protein